LEDPVADALRTLRIEFETPEAYQREYDSNLFNGGAFVRTEEGFELRAAVRVQLWFEYARQSVTLDAEVVHIVPPEMTEMGGVAGVAVQFQIPVAELREQLGSLALQTLDTSTLQADAGQRDAPRKPVRVAAQIEGEHEVVAGQTRNLSLTGALVDVGGQAVPLGETVTLRLEHPSSGEQRSIPAQVARQVESNGEISALAVHFTPMAADREELERFVEELQGIEHTRRLGGISGPIAELGPQSLLQMFAASASEGTLVLRLDQEEGVICFEGGLLRLAQLGSTTGMKALVRMLSWRDGVFEFQARIDSRDFPDPPFPLEAALFDAVRQIDEGSTVDQRQFPLNGKLLCCKSAEADASESPSKVEAAVLDLATAGFTVQRALEVIPEPDPEIFRALQSLTDAGLLEVEV
jgi:Tfp pilus assembly protein PilZ